MLTSGKETGWRIFLVKSDPFWKARDASTTMFLLCSVASSPLQVTQALFALFQNTYSSAIPYFENRILQNPSTPPLKMVISDNDYTAGGSWTGMIVLLFAIGLHIYTVISSNA